MLKQKLWTKSKKCLHTPKLKGHMVLNVYTTKHLDPLALRSSVSPSVISIPSYSPLVRGKFPDFSPYIPTMFP
jgi:hypothetical protein